MNKKTLSVLFAAMFFAVLSDAQTTKHRLPGGETITVVHSDHSKAPKGVKLRITQPADGDVVEGPNVTVKFELSNFEIGREGEHGPHIHFILDNEPYIPHYSKEAFVFENVNPGAHVIRAFPSRAWHESIKQQGAFAMVQFYVGDKKGELPIDSDQPMIVYSRPKDEYIIGQDPPGQPHEGILVDFFVHNVTLSSKTGYNVGATIDGERLVWLNWMPHYLQGLKPGEHTIKLQLLKDGKPVEGNFNTTERTFKITAAGQN